MNHHAALGKILSMAHGDPLSCLLSIALWLRFSKSILVQVTTSAEDTDLTCFMTFLFRDATCLPVGPTSLDWPVNPFGRSDSTGPLLPPDAPSDGLQRVALPAFERSVWRQGTLHAQPQITTYYRLGWMWSLPLRRFAMYYLEHLGPRWICFLQTKEQRVQTQLSQNTFGPQQHH